MKFFKKRKNKVLLCTFGGILASSILISSIFYASSSHSSNRFITKKTDAKANLIPKDNLDYENASPSNTDNNLKETLKPAPIP